MISDDPSCCSLYVLYIEVASKLHFMCVTGGVFHFVLFATVGRTREFTRLWFWVAFSQSLVLACALRVVFVGLSLKLLNTTLFLAFHIRHNR